MPVDDLSIINEALAKIGQGPITALDEESKRARSVSLIYGTTIGAVFAAERWRFARRTVSLTRLDLTPETGYRFAFALPGDRVGPPLKVLTNPRDPDRPLRRFVVEGAELHADHEPLWATFVRRIDPEDWPATFRLAAVTALAADLCIPETHDTTLAASLRQEAWGTPSENRRGGLVGAAMAQDIASDPGPAPLLASDDLTDARLDGPWYGNF